MSQRLPNVPLDYAGLLAEVKRRIRDARYTALRAVNKELVGLYWDIGRLIVERQLDANHGASIVERLAADLRHEFPGVRGFSRRNVFYMREWSIWRIVTGQKCSHWLHKSAGPTISRFSSGAKTRYRASSTSV